MKILFVCARVGEEIPSFVQKDIDILSSKHEVRVVVFERLRKNFCQLVKGAIWADISFAWFAALHALVVVVLCRILRKKSIVIAGGFDVASVPELNYGQTLHFWGRIRTILTIRLANLVLAVSEFTREEAVQNAKGNIQKIKVIYHGFNIPTGRMEDKKENLVVTISHLTKDQIERKGILTFIESAKYLPKFDFKVVGSYLDNSVENLQRIKTPNVELLGYLSQRELDDLLKRAKVSVQVSIHEGFGCSLAETMLHECVPVVTREGAIPEVVGETGLYVPVNDPKLTAQAILTASKSDLGMKARERIIKTFPLERRKQLILETVASLA